MIGYVTVGTNDLDRARKYFDALFEDLGGKRAMEADHITLWTTQPGQAMVAAVKPHDGNPATAGNGTMVALAAPSREMVDKLHAKALALGSQDEGAPGARSDNFYGAYFRDLDGNKFCVFHMG